MPKRLSILAILSLFLLSCLSSCSTPATPAAATPTAPPTLTPLPTLPLPPASTATATLVPAIARAAYTLNVVMDYDAHSLSVDQGIIYPNHTGGELTSLVLAVVPNLWADCFTLTSLSVDGTPVTNYTLNGQRLELPLPAPLGPEKMAGLSIQYTLALPFAEQEDPSVSRPRIFGYTKAQANLTNWYPFVVPHLNGAWVLHDPWYYGEHLVYDAADYEVNLKFTNINAPVVASSGAPQPNGDSTRYTLTAGRAFVFSMSREFKVATQQVGDVLVSSYFFPFYDGGGQASLLTTVQAVQIYSQRFGPYPHKSLAVVMGDFNDGMEYSALYYLSRDFYNLYDNTLQNYLVFVAAHETAHQWWFEQVASDQALYPWLDEALATYSERIYYESIAPDTVPWWWSYRIDFYNPQGFVDIPVYEGGGFRPYTNAVYFRGAHFLEDLRARVGDEIFFAFLQDYFAQGQQGFSTPEDFFRILRAHTNTDISDLIRQYFQNAY
jgi:hypothetical protein